MQPFIAITAGEVVRHQETWTPLVHGQFSTYTNAIVHAGGAPFIVPLVDDEAVLRRLYEQCSGLLLAGGDDLDPSTYHAKQSTRLKKTSLQRDKQELLLLNWALADNKAILGI